MLPPSVSMPDVLKGVDDLIRSDFGAFKELWFSRLLLATGLVALGLLLEAPEIYHDAVNAVRKLCHSNKPNHEAHPYIKLAGVLGWVLIIAGVTGEYVLSRVVQRADDFGQTFDEILLADTTKKAGNAATSAETARREADAAKADAKEITGRLNAAIQRLELLGPRWQLLEDHKTEFIEALKPRAPQHVTLVSCGMTVGGESLEANRLRDDLGNFLGNFDEGKKDGAGWDVDWKDATWGECLYATEDFGTLTRGDGGIVLVLSTTQDLAAKHEAMASANKLKDTLNKLGITTRTDTSTRASTAGTVSEVGSFWKLIDDDPKRVFLLIGPNPMFRLSKAERRLNANAGE